MVPADEVARHAAVGATGVAAVAEEVLVVASAVAASVGGAASVMAGSARADPRFGSFGLISSAFASVSGSAFSGRAVLSLPESGVVSRTFS